MADPFSPFWTPRTLAKAEMEWEFTTVKTLTVDDQKRIRIPDAKPRQVFAYANNGDGTLTLTLVKAEAREPFPRGSLLKYFTPEKNSEELALLSGCTLAP
jgi:hypothetical protein